MLKNKNSIIFIVNLACINGDENTVKYILKENIQAKKGDCLNIRFDKINNTYMGDDFEDQIRKYPDT